MKNIARVTLLLLLAGCQAPADKAAPDPALDVVTLGAAGGWDARLLWTSDCGVWTVELAEVLPRAAGPEIVALDDRGRCALLNLYATKVSYWQPVMDGYWLGGVAHADIDPWLQGPELYLGGKRGNLYQVVPLEQGGFDSRVVAYFPGKEIHTLCAVGKVLYAGLISGEWMRLEPAAGEWKVHLAHRDPGRIRDAVVVGGKDVVYVSGSGRLVRLDGEKETELYRCPQGLARIDRGSEPDVYYAVGDDGQVMRIAKSGGRYEKEMIYAGPPGARGIARGRFFEDPRVEGLALFGYSGNVEILRKTPAGWKSEKIFRDVDKGHWLVAGELDDRNATDEIVISGYGGRVVLLSRPAGYGL
jgi:hypothetical protein